MCIRDRDRTGIGPDARLLTGGLSGDGGLVLMRMLRMNIVGPVSYTHLISAIGGNLIVNVKETRVAISQEMASKVFV